MSQPASLRKDVVKKLYTRLSNQQWRLNNLYKIIDKSGRLITFKLNDVQKDFLKNQHNFNVILKARQLGFTTFICIYILDCLLFQRNKQAGVIAHTLNDAKKIFTKIKLAYESLPIDIQNAIPLITKSKTELAWSNGSSISVGSSMRSGTLQYLLISEFGKICARMPDKAQEIITGSLNTLATGQHCWIESTAEGNSGHFYELCQRAQSMQRQGEQLTPLDFKFHFYAWYLDNDYKLPTKEIMPDKVVAYFNELASQGIAIGRHSQYWYGKKYITLGDDIFREYPTTPEEAFKASIEGAYYSKDIARVESEGRILQFMHEPSLPVSTFWDLGMDDLTAIVFVQFVNNEIRIIDYMEGGGEGLEYYIKALSSKPYVYGKHFAPHDIRVRELGTGVSRMETAYKLGLQFNITPNIPVIDGINAVRQMLPKCYFMKGKADKLIECLSNYRKAWDDANGVWKDSPAKSDYNHGADAFRYLAVNSFTFDDISANNRLGGSNVPVNMQSVAYGVEDSGLW